MVQGTLYRLHRNWNLPPPPPPPLSLPPSLSQSRMECRNKPKPELIKQSALEIGLKCSNLSNGNLIKLHPNLPTECEIELEIRLIILWENVNLIKQSRVRSAYRSNPMARTLIQVAAISRLWAGECKLICAGEDNTGRNTSK